MKVSLHLLCVFTFLLIQLQAVETRVFQSPFWLIAKPKPLEKNPTDKVKGQVDSTDRLPCWANRKFVDFLRCRWRENGEKEAKRRKAVYGRRLLVIWRRLFHESRG